MTNILKDVQDIWNQFLSPKIYDLIYFLVLENNFNNKH